MIGGFHAHTYTKTYYGLPVCSFCGFIKVPGVKGPKLGGMQ
jgi:hypothetical protein